MQTTAVFAEDDGESLHVRRADNAVQLAGVGPEAYLDIDGIVAAAKIVARTPSTLDMAS